MTRKILVPALNTVFYQKRGVVAWDIHFNEQPTLKEETLKVYRACGLYDMVDFYLVGRNTVMLKVRLSEKSVAFFNGEAVKGVSLPGAEEESITVKENYFRSHWSDQPAI